MTAQIRPNRMEVSDRFPMLGFSIRVDEPNTEAEVVLASDVSLFDAQNRSRRTPQNFYSSREGGTLMVPRGDGVFVVAPTVLERFIGSDKLFFGLATGRSGNGGLKVDALPRDGSPYVSLRTFTGRTLRRGYGNTGIVAPRLDWTGDAPRPGSETPGAGNRETAAPAPRPASSGPYDDGFGPMPAIPARESAWRGGSAPRRSAGRVALTLGGGTGSGDALDWIRGKVEQAVSAAGSDVSPPALIELGDASATFVTAWKAVFGLTGLFVPVNGFLASLPGLAEQSDVTLSVGPALDTPLFGGGIGVVFAPSGEVALFGIGEISLDLGSLKDFVSKLKLALDVKIKLGYNHSGIAGFASLGKVASLTVGEELVAGAEVWLDGSGSGLGGAVSIGVGFALELSARDPVRRAVPAQRIARRAVPARTSARVGYPLGSSTSASDALDWLRAKVEQAVDAVGSDVSPPALIELGDASGTFVKVWKTVFGISGYLFPVNGFLAALPGLAEQTDVTLSVGPALDTPLFGGGVGVVFAPDGQVALFGATEISLDLGSLKDFISKLKLVLDVKIKLGYNHSGIAGFASLGKVASLTVGEAVVVGSELWLDGDGNGLGGAVSIGAGFALELSADEATPVDRRDARLRAVQIGGPFANRVGEALDRGFDPNAMQSLLDTLDRQAPPARPTGVHGRPLAQAKAATRSVNWDEVELIAQPTGMGCWAAAGAMVVGWRDRVSLTPDSVAQICARSTANGLGRAEVEPFAGQMGLAVDPPQCYSADGFYDLLTCCGPLWVGKIAVAGSNAGHAVVVTGMYSEGETHFVRVADPWDRVVGAPGTPGAYASTHSTGSRYIMRYEDFQNEYELAATAYPQILHSGGSFGRSPNTATAAAPAGYAMSAAPRLRAKARAPARTRGLSAVEPVSIGGVQVTTVGETRGEVSWQLPHWSGRKHPDDVPPAEEAPYQAGVVELTGWPAVGATQAACTLRWFYNGSSLGPVHVERGEADCEKGWGLLVSGTIENDTRLHPRSASATVPGPQTVPAVCVVLNHEFHAGAAGTDLAATSRVTLYADGTHEIDNEWTRTGEGGAAAGTEARDSSRADAATARVGQAA